MEGMCWPVLADALFPPVERSCSCLQPAGHLGAAPVHAAAHTGPRPPAWPESAPVPERQTDRQKQRKKGNEAGFYTTGKVVMGLFWGFDLKVSCVCVLFRGRRGGGGGCWWVVHSQLLMFPAWSSVHPAHPDELPVPGNTDIHAGSGTEKLQIIYRNKARIFIHSFCMTLKATYLLAPDTHSVGTEISVI